MAGLAHKILEIAHDRGPIAPGDAVAATGEPRYKVLAAFQLLEELGLLDKVYSRGTYKIYNISITGKVLLERAREEGLARAIEEAVMGAPAAAPGVHASTGT